MTRLALTFAKNHLNALFDFAGVYHFKSRFRPRYESRYICAFPRTTLLSTFALFRISGMLTVNWKQLGSNSVQK